MKRQLLLSVLVLVGWFSVAAQAEQPLVRLLIVDETKSFGESVQVNILAGLLQQSGLFDITARFVDVSSSLDLPLQEGALSERFDLVIVIPLKLGQIHTIWMFGRPYYQAHEPHVAQAAQVLRGLLEKVFSLQQTVVKGIEDGLFPALVAGVFLRYGWL